MSSRFRSLLDKYSYQWTRLALFVAGLGSLAWFLIRVIPKPSRASYPCQRAAFPVASAFVIYITGLLAARFAWIKAAGRLRQRRWALAGLLVLAGIGALALSEGLAGTRPILAAAFTPSDGPNQPMGVGRGIFPGRVVWVHDPDATDWSTALNSNTQGIYYWDDNHTHQDVIDAMTRKGLVTLTGEATEAEAWDALFRHFNREHGRGDVGYQAGEVVFIKTNHVDQRLHADIDNNADMAPQVEQAMVAQLVEQAGVPESAIRLGDPSRFVADKCYDRIHALYPGVVMGEGPFYNPQNNPGTAGRVMFNPSQTCLIDYSGKTNAGGAIPTGHVPEVAEQADYIINLAIMKGHADSGVTLSGKNFYGCLGVTPTDQNHDRRASTARNYASYRDLTDLLAHPDLGGKVMLNVFDGLWGFPWHGNSSRPAKWQNAPFNNDYPSSMLFSQDAVAIDSVGVDFLREEFGDNMGGAGRVGDAAVDDYLHECAMIGDPPSGTAYDPDGDGTPETGSLGVHEHWNNPVDKLYSRNLGGSEGIELIATDSKSGVRGWRAWE